MSQSLKTNVRILRRSAYVFVALALLLGASFSVFPTSKAYADQLQSRSITLSDSGPSASTITSGVGSGTNVTYKVGFTTAHTAASLVIDFCSQDPIINDTCTAPTGLSASGATLTAITGNIGGTGWSATNSASRIKLADDGVPAHDATVGSQIFSLSGITNPSSLGTFYARIYTYNNNTWGTYNSPSTNSGTGPGNYVDYGGIALSINQIITITARVQETLTFCVSGASPSTWVTNHDCTDTVANTAPTLTLGHGTPTAILDSSAVDTGTVYSQLSTNATHGAVIAMRDSNTTCGGLSADAGATCKIPAIGTVGSNTPTSAWPMPAGTAAFGMFAAASTDDTNGVGSLTPSTTYNDGTHTTAPNYYYGMDTTAGTGVTGTYGSTVTSTSTPCYRVDDAYTFAATAALTTPAGIYTANMDMIATGTF